MWPGLEAAGLLRIPIVRIDAHILRARTALALATAAARGSRAGQGSRADLLQDCRRYRDRLAKEKRPDTAGHALLLEAGEDATGRPPAETVAQLDAAIAKYESVGMRLWATYARHRKGEVIAGAAGAILCTDAQNVMREEQIKNPARWLDVVAPGAWRGPPTDRTPG
jgi:hypothetical protein